MLKAPILENESERLKALLDLSLLDTLPEQVFDNITSIASYICGCPISLISLIDEERQWFKSKVGLDAPETPRDISFCGHAIHQDKVFIVEDSSKDDRFADNPLVVGDPKVIFYAGAPLTTPEGLSIGTLCVIDHKPNQLSKEQTRVLQILANQVVMVSQMRKQILKLNIINSELVNLSKIVNRSSEDLVLQTREKMLENISSHIVHEFNNPLTIVLSRCDLVINKINNEKVNPQQIIPDIKAIYSSAERVSKIVSALKDFSMSDDKIRFYYKKLIDIINDSIEFFSQKIKENKLEIKLNISPEIVLECDVNKLTQCFVNLLSNSIDALEHLSNKWVCINAIVENDVALIEFIDSGSGIKNPVILENLMMPFISSKKEVKSVGLGLAVVKGIIGAHKGSVVYDKLSENTKFIIKIPVFQNKVET